MISDRKRTNLGIGCVGIFCFSFFIFLRHIPKNPEIHSDTIRHLFLVRDCINGYGCHLRASPDTGSILGISHGAVFLHFLTMVHYLGGGIRECYIIIAFCTALAVTLLFYLGSKVYGTRTAFPAILLLTYYISFRAGALNVLWEPSLLFLPAVLFVFSSLCYVHTKKLTYFMISALALSVGIQIHLSFLMHFSGFLYLIYLTSKEKRFDTALLGIACVAFLMVIASTSMFQNINMPTIISDSSSRISIFSILMALITGCILLPPMYLSYRSLKYTDHVSIFLLMDCYFWWFMLSFSKDIVNRYFFPLMPAIVLLISRGLYVFLSGDLFRQHSVSVRLSGNIKRFSGVFIGFVLLFFVLDMYRKIPLYNAERNKKSTFFTMNDAYEMSKYLNTTWKCDYGKVFRHLRGGSEYWELLNGIGYYYPVSFTHNGMRNSNACNEDFAVFKSDATGRVKRFPENWVALKNARKGIVLLYRYKPYLQWDAFDACVSGGALESSCAWKRVSYSFVSSNNPKLLASRWPFGITELASSFKDSFILYIKVPVYVPAGGPPRIIFVPAYRDDADTCGGTIEEVTGLSYAGKLPLRMIRINEESTSQSGIITFSWMFGRGSSCSAFAYHWMPPAVLELTPEQMDFYLENTKTYSRYRKGDMHRKLKRGKINKTAINSIPFSKKEKIPGMQNVIYRHNTPKEVTTVPLVYVMVIMTGIASGMGMSVLFCLHCDLTGSQSGK